MPYTFTHLLTDGMVQNWRAVVTILVTVPPNLPGLIASINPAVQIGGAFKIFDFAWLFGVSRSLYVLQPIIRRADVLQFFVSLVVYSSLSLMLPAKETFVDEITAKDQESPDEIDATSLSESKESVLRDTKHAV